MTDTAPAWLQRTVRTAGLLLAIPGVILAINLFCIVPFVLLSDSGTDAIIYGVISLTVTLLTLGAGGVAFWQAHRSLNQKPSHPLRLPSPLALVGAFILFIELGVISRTRMEFLFPIILVLCAMLPPLWAVSWMIPYTPAEKPIEKASENAVANAAQAETTSSLMTWRRGLLAFAGGATVSVLIALVLEVLLPVVILSLVLNLADEVRDSIYALFTALSTAQVASSLTSQGFIFLFVQLAVIAPLAEELAKPLVTLPLLRNLNRQQTFWIGTLAGAGFAALENIIYATSGLSFWAGILLVRALGSALHPLGSGLMALAWRDLLRNEANASTNWWRRFGLAVAVHAAWNGGSLLIVTLAGARFFGELPAEIDILGLSAAGTTLAFLILLGILALWIGRSYGDDKPLLEFDKSETPDARFVLSDRAVAIWGALCLAAIVPAGIAGLMLWLR